MEFAEHTFKLNKKRSSFAFKRKQPATEDQKPKEFFKDSITEKEIDEVFRFMDDRIPIDAFQIISYYGISVYCIEENLMEPQMAFAIGYRPVGSDMGYSVLRNSIAYTGSSKSKGFGVHAHNLATQRLDMKKKEEFEYVLMYKIVETEREEYCTFTYASAVVKQYYGIDHETT